MLFGLRNASSTFQLAIHAALSEDKIQFELFHLDNIVVFSLSAAELIYHVKRVLLL